MPILGAIIGATGAGKTALSLEVASRLNSEIICMDSRQVFRGFRIGTAQPSCDDRTRIAHHLVDFLDPCEAYSAARFVEDVKKIINDHQDKRFILVGGTGMYLQTLVQGLSPLPPADPEIRESLRVRFLSQGEGVLYSAALEADPGIREKIMPGDTQRLLRVLEVQAQGAGRWTDWLGKRVGGIGPIRTLWINMERESLYRRINERVDAMFASGWAAEVANLAQSVPPEAPAWQSLGYREIRAALEKGSSLKPLYETLRQQTRHYAKRQLTWFRNQGDNEPVLYENGTWSQAVERVCAALSPVCV